MSLVTLPDAVIARLRAQCAALFGDRVFGAANEEEGMDNDAMGLPHAVFIPASTEPNGDDQLSPYDVGMTVRFRVLIAVSNKADRRGQSGSAAALAAAVAVAGALQGWSPDLAKLPPFALDGIEDGFDSNPDRMWGRVVFRANTMASLL